MTPSLFCVFCVCNTFAATLAKTFLQKKGKLGYGLNESPIKFFKNTQ